MARSKQVQGEFYARLFVSICLTIGIFIISNSLILEIVTNAYEAKIVKFYEYIFTIIIIM